MIAVKNSAGVNRSRQFKAMLNKHWLLKKRNISTLVFEFVFPFGCGALLWYLGIVLKCKPEDHPNDSDYCNNPTNQK